MQALLLLNPLGGFCGERNLGRKVFNPELFIPNNLKVRFFVCFPTEVTLCSQERAYVARYLSSGIKVALDVVGMVRDEETRNEEQISKL